VKRLMPELVGGDQQDVHAATVAGHTAWSENHRPPGWWRQAMEVVADASASGVTRTRSNVCA
jgi:hypothetical protein